MKTTDLKIQHAHAFTVSSVFPLQRLTAMRYRLYRLLEKGAAFQTARTELQAVAEAARECLQEPT